jgi:DNA repair protein RadA/Sms
VGSGGVVPVALTEAPPDPPRAATGIDEVDRVLGGGIVRGSVVLLAGEPGIGKSTLVLQLLAGVASHDASTLLVSGEESIEQVAARAARLGLTDGRIRVAASPSLPALLAACDADPPAVVVVDSIQTLVDERLESAPGSVTQVRECAAALVGHAKRTGTAVILVGHVTKDGGVAGPKTLEHVVDVVLSLDGDRSGTLRLLRSAKNRFGATDETGVFVMSSIGLEPVADPSAFLLADRRAGVAGSIVFPSLEGSRPVLVEIQGLVDTETKLPQPRRVAIGLESRRLSMLVGVLSTRGDLPLAGRDLFVAAAGGLAVREPAADLAVCLALYSASLGIPIDARAVAVGEVGLSGEIRRVPAIARRLAEARRLGFSTAYVPFGFDESIAGLRLLRVPDLAATFEQARGATSVSA